MKRRNTEGAHPFSAEVSQACGIYDLQGLLMNRQGEFTAAVEAYEIEPADHFRQISGDFIPEDELYVKSVLAERIGVPLYLLIHRTGKSWIAFYEVSPDHRALRPICTAFYRKTEAEFLKWWREKKQTIQTKAYRSDFQKRVEDSYFDTLLEAHGEKWGGNVDGYLVSRDGRGDVDIWGVIENRFTNKETIRNYDPQKYFRFGGGDYYTWLPLILLSGRLGLPLFLATYSNKACEERLMGLTRVEGLDNSGVAYAEDEAGRQLRPCGHILSDAAEIRRWLQNNKGAPPPSLG